MIDAALVPRLRIQAELPANSAGAGRVYLGQWLLCAAAAQSADGTIYWDGGDARNVRRDSVFDSKHRKRT